MKERNDIMNITEYEITDTRPSDIQISGTDLATQLVALIPNAITAPLQRYHEMELKTELELKNLEYREKALVHRTIDRSKLCDTMVEFAKNNALDDKRFQMFMVAYVNQDI